MSFNPGPNDRYVETSFLTILELLKDYTEDVPQNARVLAVQYDKRNKGQINLLLDSPDWGMDEASKPLLIHFDLRRYVPVGSGNE